MRICEDLEAQEWKRNDVKLASCAITRGDVSRRTMHEWIHYHRFLGVDHFWIYVNEPWNLDRFPKLPFVTYVPYNFYWYEHSMHSSYRLPHQPFWQEPMQFQCLYRAKKIGGIDWLLTTDSDEYILVTSPSANAKLRNATTEPILANLLDEFSASTQQNNHVIGGLEMNSIPYGRNKRLDPPEENMLLVMDHTWRRKGDVDEYKRNRMKILYRVETTQGVGVHYLWKGGRELLFWNPSTQAYILHYKQFQNGVFQTPNPDDLTQDTRLADMFRNGVLKAVDETSVYATASG